MLHLLGFGTSTASLPLQSISSGTKTNCARARLPAEMAAASFLAAGAVEVHIRNNVFELFALGVSPVF